MVLFTCLILSGCRTGQQLTGLFSFTVTMVIAKGSLSWFIASAGSNPDRTMITSGCAQYLVSVQRIVTLEFDAKQATYNSYLFLEEKLLSRIFCRTCTCESAVAYWLAGRTLDRKIGELVVQGLVRLNLRTKTPCTVKIRSTVKGLVYKKGHVTQFVP